MKERKKERKKEWMNRIPGVLCLGATGKWVKNEYSFCVDETISRFI